MSTPNVTLTREQLYELVWNEPTRTIAARYGLSDRGLAKICIRLHVPLPGRGYWQKKAVDKEVWRARLRSLPDTATPAEREVVVGSKSARRPEAPLSAAARQQALLERAPERTIHVAASLADPHPLVERTARSLRRARRDHRGLLVPEAQRIIDVRVTRGTLDRALLISDALIKALEERGYLVTCTATGERKTSVQVAEEEIAFMVEERIRRVEKQPEPRSKRDLAPYLLPPLRQYEYVATGELAIRLTDQDFVNSRRTWHDTAKRRLETQLNQVMVGLVATAEAKKIERKRREEAHRQWEERRRQDEERQRRRFEEERKVRLLEADLAARAKSQEIRAYIQGVLAAADARTVSDGERSLLETWLNWVAGYADRLDPAIRGTAPRDPWSVGA